MLLWDADLAVDSTTFLAGSIQNQRPIHSTQLCLTLTLTRPRRASLTASKRILLDCTLILQVGVRPSIPATEDSRVYISGSSCVRRSSIMDQPPPPQGHPPGQATPENDTTGEQPPASSGTPAHSPKSPVSSGKSNPSADQGGNAADPGTTETASSLSMPPPARPAKSPRATVAQSSLEPQNPDTGNDDAASVRSRTAETSSLRSSSSLRDVVAASDDQDSETPRLNPGTSADYVGDHKLPDPAMPSSRSSFSEADKELKRMSISSIYSMASARGIPSSAASVTGSDTGSAGTHRSVSGIIASSSGKQGETGVSNVTVTTGSQGNSGGNLAPRDQHQHLAEAPKRNHPQPPRSDPSGGPRPQPIRERSRAKRRLSGSTAASSHSPSSDRTPHHREKEEG